MPGSRAAWARRSCEGALCPGIRGFSFALIVCGTARGGIDRNQPSGLGGGFFLAVPFRIPLPDGLGAGLERVALVELEGLRAVGPLLGHLAGEGLDRGGG